MVTGGEFKPPTLSLTGEKAGKFFEQIHVGKCFLAAGGVSLEAGLTYPGLIDIQVKKAMIDAAAEVFVVADSTKIGKVSFASLGPIDLADCIITDDGISDSDRLALQLKGVKVIIA
jgi:DeoR/GlpR family transcriptional regulator of sugar metabolism